MTVINEIRAEGFKRLNAVQLRPTKSGLTIIGGKNGQGKTSVLDAIAWALGGEKYRPSNPQNADSVIPPTLNVKLSNGIIVERKGKNGALTVLDPSGRRAGQKLLDGFIEKLALDLPKFMEASDAEKANTLLNIIGVGPQLTALEQEEKNLYNERLAIGRIADQKSKYAKEQPYYPDVPEEPVSAADLIRQQQEILARNGQREMWRRQYDSILGELLDVKQKIEHFEGVLRDLKRQESELTQKSIAAQKSPRELQMESTAELEESIERIDEINEKVRANLSKAKAEEDAQQYLDQYAELTAKLEDTRAAKKALLDGAQLPLPGLTVEDGRLLYNGQPWDNMSGSERLIVAAAIVRKLNPECGFVLMDKLEQLDLDTLQEFGTWLEQEGLQVIATRVSTGDECSIIIVDGYGDQQEQETPEPALSPAPAKWKRGEF